MHGLVLREYPHPLTHPETAGGTGRDWVVGRKAHRSGPGTLQALKWALELLEKPQVLSSVLRGQAEGLRVTLSEQKGPRGWKTDKARCLGFY